MMTTKAPDIFSNVHKGIRKALFDACIALGRAGNDDVRAQHARNLRRDALRFLDRHGENEDLLLLPLLEDRAPACFAQMERAHGGVNEAVSALTAKLNVASPEELYGETCMLTARYLDHMQDEERELQPAIQAALSAEELIAFSRRSAERTAPDDQRMMVSFMLPAMTEADAKVFLSRLPLEAAERLRPSTK
jgi:hypothetical protein